MEIESLYSLEVYVRDVSNLSLLCGIPAVTFRFLDYPTVIIYLMELCDLEKLKKKFNNEEISTNTELNEFQNLRNQSNGYVLYCFYKLAI